MIDEEEHRRLTTGARAQREAEEKERRRWRRKSLSRSRSHSSLVSRPDPAKTARSAVRSLSTRIRSLAGSTISAGREC
jgi:hypothetical protein